MVASLFEPSLAQHLERVAVIKQAVGNMLSEVGSLRRDHGLALDDFPVELEESRQLLRKLYSKLELIEEKHSG